MPSLDFEAEKVAFRDYYNDNAHRFEQAKDAFLTLLGSLLADGDLAVAAITGRIKDREESIKKFTRKYQSALEKDETPYKIKDHIRRYGISARRAGSRQNTDLARTNSGA